MTLKKRILALLEKGTPMLSMDMAVALNVSKAAASEAAKELNKADFVHVIEWKHSPKNGGNKVYAIGPGENVVKYVRTASVERGPFIPHADVAAAWMMTK